jgi:hypothetical protein
MKPRPRAVDYPLVIRSRGICAVIIIIEDVGEDNGERRISIPSRARVRP